MNMNFGRMKDGANIEYAPCVIRLTEDVEIRTTVYDEYGEDGTPIGDPREEVRVIKASGHLVSNPSAGQLLMAGYKPVVRDSKPDGGSDGGVWTEDVPVDEGEKIRIGWKFVEVDEDVAPRHWTPLTLKRGAVDKGWWDAFKGILEQAGGYEDFVMCQFISEDDPMFGPIYQALCGVYGKESVDAYLDELPTEA